MAEYDEQIVFEMGYNKGFKDGIKGSILRERIDDMKNEFIDIGIGSGWLDISLSDCLEIIDKYTKEQNNGSNNT